MDGKAIRKLRKKEHLSQRDLADIVGVSVRTISRWEANDTTPNKAETDRLKEYFKIDDKFNDTSAGDKDNEQINILESISDGVDNLVSGQDNLNESLSNGREEFRERQERLIEELNNQNSLLIEKLEANRKELEEIRREHDLQRDILRQKKIRNIILLVAAILIVGLVLFFFWYLVNFGMDPDTVYYVQGPVVVDEVEEY